VCHDNPADLLDLIRLGLATSGLEIQDLGHAVSGEDMMVTANPLGEAQMDQQRAEVIEADVRVRRPAEDAIQGLRPCS
jgi:hypothetical protein